MTDLIESIIYLSLNKNALKILILLRNGWIPINKLTKKMELARGTLHYYAKKLEDMGLISCKKVAGRKFCKATEVGMRALSALGAGSR